MYYRDSCPWAREVLAFLDEKKFPYEGREITADAGVRKEMTERTGQDKSPCVEIDGHMLVDVGRREVESHMKSKGLL